MQLCAELGEWDWRRVMRDMDGRDLGVWLAFYRIQTKAREKDQQDAEARAVRARHEHRLKQGAP